VVPFLVLLPLVESNDVTTMGAMDLLSQLGPTALTTVGSLGLLLLGGRTILRRVFQARGCSAMPCLSHVCHTFVKRAQRCRVHSCSLLSTLSFSVKTCSCFCAAGPADTACRVCRSWQSPGATRRSWRCAC